MTHGQIERLVKAVESLTQPTITYTDPCCGRTWVNDEELADMKAMKFDLLKSRAACQKLAANLEDARQRGDRYFYELGTVKAELARIIQYERREKCKAQDALKKGYRGRVAELQADNERKEQVIQRQIGYIEQYKRRLAVTDLSREDCSAWCPGCPACKR